MGGVSTDPAEGEDRRWLMMLKVLYRKLPFRVRHFRRLQRARHLQRKLGQAGYTAADLQRIAQLRAVVEPRLENVACGIDQAICARPDLEDVLRVWGSQ